MLRAIVISEIGHIADELEARLGDVEGILSLGSVRQMPDTEDLPHVLCASAVEVVLIDFSSLDRAVELTQAIIAKFPGVQIVAVCPDSNATSLLTVLRAGARGILRLPLNRVELCEALAAAQRSIESNPPIYPLSGKLVCVLPSRGGVGATTLAVNLAGQLAAGDGNRTLLADFDLNSSVTRFMLGIFDGASTVDAVEQAASTGGPRWPELVHRKGPLEVITAGRPKLDRRLPHNQLPAFVSSALRLYRHVVVDVSPQLEHFSQSMMRLAHHVFLVTTPELPSVHMAREKQTFLRELGVQCPMSVLLNRADSRSELTASIVSQLVGEPVEASLPNDYREVGAALREARAVSGESRLGKALSQLALKMTGVTVEPARTASLLASFAMR